MELNLIKTKLIKEYNEHREKGYSYRESYNRVLKSINHWISELSISRIKKESSLTLDAINKLSSFVLENVNEWVGAPKVICSDALPEVIYHFPKENGNHPFNIECNDKYFIYANGLSYSYSKYIPDSKIFGSNDICRKIPMGYKVLYSYEKKVFIKNGEMVKGFEEIPEQTEGEEYTIITTSEYLGERGYKNYP